MALTLLDPARQDKPMTSVLAQYKRASEIITAAYHSHDTGTYIYTVRIDGGKHSGIEFHCRMLESALWLFDQIVYRRKRDLDWIWLWPIESL